MLAFSLRAAIVMDEIPSSYISTTPDKHSHAEGCRDMEEEKWEGKDIIVLDYIDRRDNCHPK